MIAERGRNGGQLFGGIGRIPDQRDPRLGQCAVVVAEKIKKALGIADPPTPELRIDTGRVMGRQEFPVFGQHDGQPIIAEPRAEPCVDQGLGRLIGPAGLRQGGGQPHGTFARLGRSVGKEGQHIDGRGAFGNGLFGTFADTLEPRPILAIAQKPPKLAEGARTVPQPFPCHEVDCDTAFALGQEVGKIPVAGIHGSLCCHEPRFRQAGLILS